MFIYPENLKARATLFLWRLGDLAAVGICLLFSALIAAGSGFTVPLAATGAYAFLCIRVEDTSIKDFIRYAAKYFITEKQEFKWKSN